MLPAQRRSLILEQVQSTGAVRVTDLVDDLGVSDMTVRRDLDALARDGLIRKVHGGAVPPLGPSTEEPGFEIKLTRQEREKEAIARAAASLVQPNTAVGLSAGTTTCAVARHLLDVPGLTVATNCLRVANAFHQSPRADQTIVLTGGVRTPSDALVGPLAVRAMRDLHLDVLLLGVHGMQESAGFTTPNLMEAEANRALVAAARKLVVVADHTKWGVVGISTIAPLDRCDVLVTNTEIAPDARQVLSDHVETLLLADENGSLEQAG